MILAEVAQKSTTIRVGWTQQKGQVDLCSESTCEWS